MTIIDQTYPNPQYEPKLIRQPSYDLMDAIKLPLLFHDGGQWTGAKAAEWLRITGTTEATTKVMCNHLRSAIAVHHCQECGFDTEAVGGIVRTIFHRVIE